MDRDFARGPVIVLPSEKILRQMSEERLAETSAGPLLFGAKDLVPQEEVLGESPATTLDTETASTTEKQQGASRLPSEVDPARRRPESAGAAERIASRPDRLKTRLEGASPDRRTELREHPSLSPSPLVAPPGVLEADSAESTVKKAWPEPESLCRRLEELTTMPQSASWARQTLEDLQAFGEAMEEGSPQAPKLLARLEKSVAAAPPLAQELSDFHHARRVRQAGYALQRRVDIWRGVLRLGETALIEAERPGVDRRQMALCLANLDSLTRGSEEGRRWREYLLTDVLRNLTTRQRQIEEHQQRLLAQKVLDRIVSTPMSKDQRQFLDSPPVTELCKQLQRLAAEPIAPTDVLHDLERYEQSRRGSDARRLVFTRQVLSLSSNPERRAVAEQLDRHYRNANLRVALSEEFLNLMVPESQTEIAPVRDTVLGLPVRGRSLTSADVSIQLVPDPQHVRLELEITGETASMTSSRSGPATFHHDSESLYTARKPVEIDQKGIRLLPSEINVRHQSRLRNVVTRFDGIPLLGPIVRGVARSQHDQARGAANREVRQKVAVKARKRLDTEAKKRLTDLVDRLNQNVLGPLEHLALEPTIIEAQTTDERLTMRLRVAGEDQLGSHTPRPQAPADCLASFQVNETMLNNALARLQLEGKTLTLGKLAERIASRFQRPDLWQVPPEHEDAMVTFAPKDPVRIRCENGQVILELAIAEFSKPPRCWQNFHVCIFYRPQIDGRKVELVRKGTFHLIAEGLNLGSQIALRGAFSKAFPKNRTIAVTPEQLTSNPKFEDLHVTQFVIDDGWIGMALGAEVQAVRTSMR